MVDRAPKAVLRLEGAALFGAALALYLDLDYSVLALLLLFLVPDLSFAAYAVNASVGAVAYNAMHTLVWPLTLAAAGVLGDDATLVQVALIWSAHIGLDRALGYGLKYPSAFRDTHLQRV